eukprot:gene5341-6810_t
MYQSRYNGTVDREGVDREFLRDFILYARNNVAPDISVGAKEALVQGYLAMRALGGRGGKTITATPRQLESLIRISQALAKMRLEETVTAEDVAEAIRLMKVATQAAATDPRTGTIDMDLLATGRSSISRDLFAKLAEEVSLFLARRNGQRFTLGQMKQMMINEQRSKESAASGMPSADGTGDGGPGGKSSFSSALYA